MGFTVAAQDSTLFDEAPGNSGRGRIAASWAVALAVSVSLHVGMWQVLPDWTFTPPAPGDAARWQTEGAGQIELVFEKTTAEDPAKTVPPKEETLPRFAQANPDLPSEEPDQPEFFGAANQREAQKTPQLSQPETAAKIEGELADSTSVKTGKSQTEALPEMIAGSFALGGENRPGENQPQQATAPPPPPPQPSFYEARPDQPTSPDGLASRLSPADKGRDDAPGTKPSDFPVVIPLNLPEGQRREGENEGGNGEAAVAQQQGVPAPRPRPKLSPDVMSTVLMKREGNARQAEGQAVNLKFSQYGEYLQKMFESISSRWHELNRTVPSIMSEVGTQTLVVFRINRQGEIVSCEVRSSTSAKVTQSVCMDAIRSRAPFGPWTEEMVRVLNEEEEIRIRFHYR